MFIVSINAETVSFDFGGEIVNLVDSNSQFGFELGDQFFGTVEYDLSIADTNPTSGGFFPDALVDITLNVGGVDVNFAFRGSTDSIQLINRLETINGEGDEVLIQYRQFGIAPLEIDGLTFILRDVAAQALSSDQLTDFIPSNFPGGEFSISSIDNNRNSIAANGILNFVNGSGGAIVPEPDSFNILLVFCVAVFFHFRYKKMLKRVDTVA